MCEIFFYVVYCDFVDEGIPFYLHLLESIDRVLVRHVETIWRANKH